MGGWLDCERTFGLEGSGFLLEQRIARFSAASDANGNPAINVPLFRADLGREGAFTISTPDVGNGAFVGNLKIASASRLWGAEVNGYANLLRSERWTFDGLAGFRYLDLQESFQLQATTDDVSFDILTNVNDRFATRNQFYGGQLGGRLHYQRQALSFDLTGKVALGCNHEVVEISGFGSQSGTGVPGFAAFPGGIFAQTSNIGRQTKNQFNVVPQVQFKAGWDFSSWFRGTVGYDFLYWNQVVRAGSQIDRSVNATQALGGTLAGSPSPAPLFNRSDFFAHGVSFGLEFRY